MGVLELDEDSRSLREAARAWGRGELGVDDYRMIRRATLEGKLGLEPGASVDDTAEPAASVGGDPDDDTEVVDSVPVGPPPASSPGMFIGGALVAALVLVLLGFLVL